MVVWNSKRWTEHIQRDNQLDLLIDEVMIWLVYSSIADLIIMLIMNALCTSYMRNVIPCIETNNHKRNLCHTLSRPSVALHNSTYNRTGLVSLRVFYFVASSHITQLGKYL